MKKVILSLFVSTLVLAGALATPVYAIEKPHQIAPRDRGHAEEDNHHEDSEREHEDEKDHEDRNHDKDEREDREHATYATLALYEKNPEDWSVVEEGAYGRLKYMTEDQPYQNRRLFLFQARGLEPDTDYTLIRYMDPWPGYPVACLGEATSNSRGAIPVLRGEMMAGGPKVWLVLSSDVDCDAQQMVGWNPTEYLFENNLINDYNLVETVEVDAANDTPTMADTVLEDGETYLLVASGTADACDGCADSIMFDADYSLSFDGDSWTDDVTGYESYGDELLDLQVNGSSVDWGAFNEEHSYWYFVNGDGSNLELSVYDVFYPNNSGSLTVEVYKL